MWSNPQLILDLVTFVEEIPKPNKAGLFEGSFFWGVSLIPPPSFIFHEELMQYEYNLIQLLNKLFKVGRR